MSGLGCTQGSSDLKESLRTQLMQRFPQREILQAGEFAFEPEELRSWMEQYARENPAEALRMIASIQTEAIIALASSGASGEVSP